MNARNELYTRVTDQIVSALESADPSAWRAPWHSSAALTLPRNVVSAKTYRGVNVPLLWGAQFDAGYDHALWGTYKQWSEKGGQVRKGSRGTPVLFWRPVDKTAVVDEGEVRSRYLVARQYSVFNVGQVDGYELPGVPVRDVALTCTTAAAFFGALGASVTHGGGRAYYTPAADRIQLPHPHDFRSEVDYWATSAHEHVHWTAPAHRADRAEGLANQFGSAAYALEELVAELGAAYACAHLGLSNEPRADHAQYIGSWVQACRDDPHALITAASRAQYAFDWLVAHAAVETAQEVAA